MNPRSVWIAVTSVHCVILLLILFLPSTRTMISPKKLSIQEKTLLVPKIVPASGGNTSKKESSSTGSLPKPSSPKPKKPTPPPPLPKPVPIKASPKPKTESEKKPAPSPVTQKTKTSPSKKKLSPQTSELLKQTLDSLENALEHPKEKTSSSTAKKGIGSLASEGLQASDSMPTYQELIALTMQRLLQLPEPGEVRLYLTLKADGTVISLKIDRSSSAKNKEYVERNLQTLSFPCFTGALKKENQHTFPITLNGDTPS